MSVCVVSQLTLGFILLCRICRCRCHILTLIRLALPCGCRHGTCEMRCVCECRASETETQGRHQGHQLEHKGLACCMCAAVCMAPLQRRPHNTRRTTAHAYVHILHTLQSTLACYASCSHVHMLIYLHDPDRSMCMWGCTRTSTRSKHIHHDTREIHRAFSHTAHLHALDVSCDFGGMAV